MDRCLGDEQFRLCSGWLCKGTFQSTWNRLKYETMWKLPLLRAWLSDFFRSIFRAGAKARQNFQIFSTLASLVYKRTLQKLRSLHWKVEQLKYWIWRKFFEEWIWSQAFFHCKKLTFQRLWNHAFTLWKLIC